MTLYSVILLLGAAHGVFLAIVVINVKTGNVVALRLLAFLTLVFAVDLSVNFFMVAGYILHFPRLIYVESVVMFLYGPLLYFYVRTLTSRKQWRFSGWQWMHFLPFVVSVALLAPYFSLSNEILGEMIYGDATAEETIGQWALGGHIVAISPRLLIGIYLALAFRRLAQHGRNIRDQFSLIEHISLNWLRNLLIAIGVIYVLYLVALAFGGKGPVENLLNIAIVVVVYTLGYMGLRQPAIFTQREQVLLDSSDAQDVIDEKSVSTEVPKYQRSALDDDSSKLLLEELQEIMATSRPYLDSKLALSQLANQLNISSNYLSQVINQQTGSNFFDYINGHRVQAAKEILADPAQSRSNVLTIAMDSGFNSKSAFYSAFRHHAHMTPIQYRQSKVS